MAEEKRAVGRPHFEMAEPELFVDEAEDFPHGGAAVFGNADVGHRDELQHALFLAPECAELVRGPAALDAGDEFLVAGALERPAVRAEIMLEHVEGRCRGLGHFKFEFGQ